jgi:hypothetical protein
LLCAQRMPSLSYAAGEEMSTPDLGNPFTESLNRNVLFHANSNSLYSRLLRSCIVHTLLIVSYRLAFFFFALQLKVIKVLFQAVV